SWIRVIKRNIWILNSVVSGTFADLLQDLDPHHLLAQSELVKVHPKDVLLARVGAQAKAGVVAGARVCHGDVPKP
ncbi:hypothetical protein Tco_1273830, partial [Tanacetum coccineum]